MVDFIYSSRRNPCPICNRTKDSDCRSAENLILCHYGSSHHPPAGLRPGSVVQAADGTMWAYTGDTEDGRAAVFTQDKPRPEGITVRQPLINNKNTSLLARLPTPAPDSPDHLPDGHRLDYSATQWIIISRKNDKKSHIPHHLAEDGSIIKRSGPDEWPLWRQPDALAYGPGKWIVETEGEGKAEILRAGGLAAISQPGHDHKLESINRRYARLKSANISGIVYIADNDEKGIAKGKRCGRVAKSIDLPFVLLRASEIWDFLPDGGSVDDADGSPVERVKTVETIANEKILAANQAECEDLVKLNERQLLRILREKAQDGESIRWNVFHQQVEINGEPYRGIERFYLELADQGYKVGKDLAVDALVKVANENPYDPVRLYLEHCADTVEPASLDILATTYLRPQDNLIDGPTLYDHMLRCTLIGAVRRAMEPGCKHDTACIIVGSQGARKSTFWECLGGYFYSNSLGDLQNKDDLLKLAESWIMEWPEIDHITSKRHAGAIKSFVTQTKDVFRVPYGRAIEPHPRRGIIVGTANSTEGLFYDTTGNRRFWVIQTTRDELNPINTENLELERDAIWAAAVIAYREGASSDLPIELKTQVNEENEAYLTTSPWLEPIQSWIEAPANNGRVLTTELLLSEAIEKPLDRQTRGDQMQVAQILGQLGYSRVRGRVDGRLRWFFTRA